MAKLFYGSGSCTIESSEGIRGIELKYKGAIKIVKKCGDNFILMAGDRKILIFPVGQGYLNDLFEYTGELQILYVKAIGDNFERIPTTIKKVMDYSELLDTKSEDLTTKSEDLNAGITYKNPVAKTTVDVTTLNNLSTTKSGKGEYHIILYRENGDEYSGSFHIHILSGKAMTGAEHSKISEDLYIKKDDKIVKTGITKEPRRTPSITTRTMTSSTSSRGGY